jgi:copper chaperone CopZ
MVQTVFKVSGMHCNSCSMLIKDILEDENGVNSVKADFESGVVFVDFDETTISHDKLKDLIENEAGYKVEG